LVALSFKAQFMKSLIVTMFLGLLSLSMAAQDENQLIKDIHFYSDIVANAMDYKHKIRANEQLVALVDKAIEDKIQIDFDSMKWIVKVSPEDKSFTIISWPVRTAIDAHVYQGYILKGDKVIKLNDQAASMIEDYDYMIGDKDNWFGQLYYSIQEFQSKGETKYVLFGRNSYTQHEDIKIADVFYFDENDMPVFGEQLFAKDMKDLRDAKNRVILKYSDDAPIHLHYNTGLEMIVYDHLVPRMGQISGQGIIMTGDGSYEGYSLNERIWLYKEKLFDHIYEEAPRPTPVLDGGREGGKSGKKDLFGKGN